MAIYEKIIINEKFMQICMHEFINHFVFCKINLLLLIVQNIYNYKATDYDVIYFYLLKL